MWCSFCMGLSVLQTLLLSRRTRPVPVLQKRIPVSATSVSSLEVSCDGGRSLRLAIRLSKNGFKRDDLCKVGRCSRVQEIEYDITQRAM
jgi:hypothetical protein